MFANKQHAISQGTHQPALDFFRRPVVLFDLSQDQFPEDKKKHPRKISPGCLVFYLQDTPLAIHPNRPVFLQQ